MSSNEELEEKEHLASDDLESDYESAEEATDDLDMNLRHKARYDPY